MSPKIEPVSSRDYGVSSDQYTAGQQSSTSTSRPWPQSRRSFEQIEANSSSRTHLASSSTTSKYNGQPDTFFAARTRRSRPEPRPVPAPTNGSNNISYGPPPKRMVLSPSSLQGLNKNGIQDPFERWQSESTRDSPWNGIQGIGIISPRREQAERKNKEGRDDSSDQSSLPHTKKRPRQSAEGARRR